MPSLQMHCGLPKWLADMLLAAYEPDYYDVTVV
jgi:hypothetical protein